MNAQDQAVLPPGLYALCDDGVRPELSLEEKAGRLLNGGVRVLQLRMKRTPEARAVQACRAVAALCRERSAICLINDRVDWALLSGAHGVHVGADDLPPAEARRLLGPERIVGATVRNLEMIHRAKEAGATYCGLGPLFATSTKVVDAPVLGLEAFARIARESPLPLVAIAGIGLANIEEVGAAGAHGAAVLSELLAARDIAEQAQRLSERFERGRRRHTLSHQV